MEIVEGVYSLHPDLRDAYDLRVFLALDPKTQVERIRARSGEAMLQRFIAEWIPLEKRLFRPSGRARVLSTRLRRGRGVNLCAAYTSGLCRAGKIHFFRACAPLPTHKHNKRNAVGRFFLWR